MIVFRILVVPLLFIFTSHLLVNVHGQIKGVCPINIICLVIGRREYSLTVYFERLSDVALEALPAPIRGTDLALAHILFDISVSDVSREKALIRIKL